MQRSIIFLILFLCAAQTVFGQERSCLFDSADVTINKLSSNSKYSDYSPAFFGNEIIFSSNRPYAFGIVTVTESDSTSPDNLYSTTSTSSKSNHLEKLNTQNQEGSACYDSINGLLYYSGSIKVESHFVLGIFCSKKLANGSWEKPVPVLVPSGSYSYFHPCVANSGKTLIVASDRQGGFGGIDLYTTNKENGQWAAPINMGGTINTSFNEAYPSFSNPDFLFFSSTGHGTIGGYDMFCCRWSENKVGAILPAGNNLNTPDDDFGLIFDPVKRMGYFSSNRDRTTGDDIYSFQINWPSFSNCVSYVEPRYCFTFSEENSLESQDASLFYYEWDFGDGQKATSLEVDHCFAGAGKYTVELHIKDRKDTAFFMSQVSYEHEIEGKTGLRINCLDTAYVGDTIELNYTGSSIADHTIEKYFWDFGDHYLISENKIKYAVTNSGNVTFQLGVTAYPEGVLIDSIVPLPNTFCTEKVLVVGTAKERFEWAEQKTLAMSNPFFNTVEKAVFNLNDIDSPEYSIFLGSSKDSLSLPQPGTGAIIRVIKEDTVFRYLYGSADSLYSIHADYIAIKSLGIDSAFVIILSKDTVVANQIKEKRDFLFTSKVAAMLMRPIPAAAITPISVVPEQPQYSADTLIAYFDVNKSSVNAETKKMLDSLVTSGATKKGATYQLIGFADSDGNAQYNLALSNSRTRAIATQLRQNGIKSTNISTYSYGEEPPEKFTAILKNARHKRCVVVIRTAAKK